MTERHRDREPDPSTRVTAAFREIERTRMRGLPFLNPHLAVEAVGFAPWDAHWLGVLVSPWSMNLLLLPRIRDAWREWPQGEKRALAFPAGRFEFIGASDALLGAYAMCSLFSPMSVFEDQAAARLVATLARAALLDSGNADGDAEASARADARATASDAPLSRRDFLRLREPTGGA